MAGEFLMIDELEYHADRGRLSGSVLKLLADDPRTFLSWCDGKDPVVKTDEIRLGSYGHALALEGSDAAKERIALAPNRHMAKRALTKAQQKQWDETGVEPERVPQDPSPEGEFRTMEVRSAENRQMWADFESSAYGRIIIKPEQVPIAKAMAKAVRQNDEAAELLGRESFTPEVSAHWTCETTGEPMRCRFDGLVDGVPGGYLSPRATPTVLELKFVAEGSLDHKGLKPAVQMRYIRDHAWAIKSALYHDAFAAITGRGCSQAWVICEMTADDPRCCVLWLEADAPMVDFGRKGSERFEMEGYIDLIKRARWVRDRRDARLDCQRTRNNPFRLPHYLEAAMINEAA